MKDNVTSDKATIPVPCDAPVDSSNSVEQLAAAFPNICRLLTSMGYEQTAIIIQEAYSKIKNQIVTKVSKDDFYFVEWLNTEIEYRKKKLIEATDAENNDEKRWFQAQVGILEIVKKQLPVTSQEMSEILTIIPADFHPNQSLKARVYELVNQLAVEKEKYNSCKQQQKDTIEYCYEFAWHYGRFYHIGDAEKIKAAISERFKLPEEYFSTLINNDQNVQASVATGDDSKVNPD